MTFYDYWRSLSDSEKQEYAKSCDFSRTYIETHLIHRRKTPPLAKLQKMADESLGAFTFHNLCDFFAEETTS